MPGKPPIDKVDLVPGPGAYNNTRIITHVKKSIKSIPIGNEPRMAKDVSSQKLVPGPGAYKMKSGLSKVGGIIGDGLRL